MWYGVTPPVMFHVGIMNPLIQCEEKGTSSLWNSSKSSHPSLILRKTPKLRGFLQHTWLVLLKTVKVIKTQKAWEAVTDQRWTQYGALDYKEDVSARFGSTYTEKKGIPWENGGIQMKSGV